MQGAFCVIDYFHFFCVFVKILLGITKALPYIDDMKSMKHTIVIGELTLEHLSAFAERTGKTVSSLKWLCRDGKLPACKIGGSWYVNLGEYERTIREKTERQNDQP